jgi:molybdate transport system substrate-binding protein
VDAAKRVRTGEPFDIVVLASDVIDQLIAEGRIVAGTRTDIVVSPIAVAVRAGSAHPDISSGDAVRRAVQRAASIGYSTGPSGAHLRTQLERWGIADELASRITVAPPGVPVGSLVARGEVEIGFQQLSEFVAQDGIDVVGTLPADVQALTTFSGGIAQASTRHAAARQVLDFMASPSVAAVKRKYGMEPA